MFSYYFLKTIDKDKIQKAIVFVRQMSYLLDWEVVEFQGTRIYQQSCHLLGLKATGRRIGTWRIGRIGKIYNMYFKLSLLTLIKTVCVQDGRDM